MVDNLIFSSFEIEPEEVWHTISTTGESEEPKRTLLLYLRNLNLCICSTIFQYLALALIFQMTNYKLSTSSELSKVCMKAMECQFDQMTTETHVHLLCHRKESHKISVANCRLWMVPGAYKYKEQVISIDGLYGSKFHFSEVGTVFSAMLWSFTVKNSYMNTVESFKLLAPGSKFTTICYTVLHSNVWDIHWDMHMYTSIYM